MMGRKSQSVWQLGVGPLGPTRVCILRSALAAEELILRSQTDCRVLHPLSFLSKGGPLFTANKAVGPACRSRASVHRSGHGFSQPPAPPNPKTFQPVARS